MMARREKCPLQHIRKLTKRSTDAYAGGGSSIRKRGHDFLCESLCACICGLKERMHSLLPRLRWIRLCYAALALHRTEFFFFFSSFFFLPFVFSHAHYAPCCAAMSCAACLGAAQWTKCVLFLDLFEI